jgi:hypothetical protein
VLLLYIVVLQVGKCLRVVILRGAWCARARACSLACAVPFCDVFLKQ